MKIFAIDPGPAEAAYVIWDGESILFKGKIPSSEILAHLEYEQYECKIVCEMIACYGMAVGAEVFETCVWIGRYLERVGGNMERITRGKVKMHLCHSMKAKDSNIRQALIDRFGAPGRKASPGITFGLAGDMWAAFAVAVTHYDNLTPKTNL
jgi:hypothetical protein